MARASQQVGVALGSPGVGVGVVVGFVKACGMETFLRASVLGGKGLAGREVALTFLWRVAIRSFTDFLQHTDAGNHRQPMLSSLTHPSSPFPSSPFPSSPFPSSSCTALSLALPGCKERPKALTTVDVPRVWLAQLSA